LQITNSNAVTNNQNPINGMMQPQTTNILNGFSYQKAALTNLANNQKSSN